MFQGTGEKRSRVGLMFMSEEGARKLIEKVHLHCGDVNLLGLYDGKEYHQSYPWPDAFLQK